MKETKLLNQNEEKRERNRRNLGKQKHPKTNLCIDQTEINFLINDGINISLHICFIFFKQNTIE